MISKYIEASILAFVQGFSEFIPVSSSAHLIIISKISNFSISSLQLDISLHLGSLLAIIFYFRKDLVNILGNKSLLLLIIFSLFGTLLSNHFLDIEEVLFSKLPIVFAKSLLIMSTNLLS